MARKSSLLLGFEAGTDAGRGINQGIQGYKRLSQDEEELTEKKREFDEGSKVEREKNAAYGERTRVEELKALVRQERDDRDEARKARLEPVDVEKLKSEIRANAARANFYDDKRLKEESEVTQMATKSRQVGAERRQLMDEYKDAFWNDMLEGTPESRSRLSDKEMALKRWDLIEQKLFAMSDKIMQPPKRKKTRTTRSDGTVEEKESWEEPLNLDTDMGDPTLNLPKSIDYPAGWDGAGRSSKPASQGGGLSTREGFLKMAMPSAAPTDEEEDRGVDFSSDDLE